MAELFLAVAVFAGADVVAMGVLETIAEAGLSVPGDVSVAGYDNTTFAALGPISLTSVDHAGHEIGRNTARLLLERITDRSRPSVQVSVSGTLCVPEGFRLFGRGVAVCGCRRGVRTSG
ncbi:substrate-binding domain-containing protein [Streptomyces sp. NPDC002845]